MRLSCVQLQKEVSINVPRGPWIAEDNEIEGGEQKCGDNSWKVGCA